MQTPRLIGRIKRAFPLPVVMLALAFFAVGCGGGNDSTASSPVTKAEFIRQANLICRKADAMQPRALDAYRAEHEKDLAKMAPVSYEETVVRNVTLPSVRKQIKELESLKAPDGEEKKVNTIIAGWRAAVRKGEKAPYAVARWDHPDRDPFTRINKIAVRYGFRDCEELR